MMGAPTCVCVCVYAYMCIYTFVCIYITNTLETLSNVNINVQSYKI